MAGSPALKIHWRSEFESSNVDAVGWDNLDNMYVLFKHGGLYMYENVSRQRVVAASRAESVGEYITHEIIPNFTGVRIV